MSVAWASATAASTKPLPPPENRGSLFPYLSLAALLLALTLVAWLVGRSQVPAGSPAPSLGTKAAPATKASPPSPQAKGQPNPRPGPKPSRPPSPGNPVASEPPANEKTEDLQRLRRQLERNQQAELARIEEENSARIESERSRRWEEQLTLLADFNQQGNFEAALTLAEKLLTEAALPEAITVRARELATSASTGLEKKQMAEWLLRLAEVEELFAKGIYTETRIQAELLAADPAAPQEITEKARKLSADAVEALRAGWSKTQVKSTTVRSQNGRPKGDGK